MKSRLLTPLIVLVALAIAGRALDVLAAPAWAATRARQPALRLDSSLAAAGQGVTLALLGGFRALVADATWIQMYSRWEARDLPGTETLIKLVAALDPRPVYFWLNGARIIGYDLPVWRVEAAGGYEAVPTEVQERIGREQGHAAVRHLELAMQYHPASADLWIERANLELNRLRDPVAAAESYRRAWEQPRAPFYAGRMHAELLRRTGRRAEALAWLVRLHPGLPPGEDSGRDLVLGRIRDLERELGVPADAAYRPAAAPAR